MLIQSSNRGLSNACLCSDFCFRLAVQQQIQILCSLSLSRAQQLPTCACNRLVRAGLNTFADEVVVHFDLFCSGMKHGVAREIYASHIVAEYADRIHDGNA